MAEPIITSCPTEQTVKCGTPFNLKIKVEFFESTDLTACCELPAGKCVFRNPADACQTHPSLPPSEIPVTFNLTVDCDETSVVLMRVVATNQHNQSDSNLVRLTIRC